MAFQTFLKTRHAQFPPNRTWKLGDKKKTWTVSLSRCPCARTVRCAVIWVTSRICRSHVTYMEGLCLKYEGVISHIWTSHVTHARVTWHINMSRITHVNTSSPLRARAMCYYSSRVSYMKESCHQYERVMSHTRGSHVTHKYESCHAHERVVAFVHTCVLLLFESRLVYQGVMSHIWGSHVTYMRESCHIFESRLVYQGVTPHVWKGYVSNIKESRHTYGRVMSHTCMCHMTYKYESNHKQESVVASVHKCNVLPFESPLPYEGVMSRIWKGHMSLTLPSKLTNTQQHVCRSHVSHMKESCHEYEGLCHTHYLAS